MSYYWRIECPVCNRGPYVHHLAIWFEEYLIALDEAYFVIAKYDVEGKFINKRGLQCYVSADNMSVEVNPSLKEVIPISDLINML